MRLASVFAILALVVGVGCTQNLPDDIPPDCAAEGLTDCGDGTCIDTQNDSNNCGACGEVCEGGATCVQGNCEVVCPADQINCDGTCIDPQNNDQYCGAVGECEGGNQGETCEGGYSCVEGSCACASPYFECADDVCVNLDTDIAHCGACFNPCPGDATGCMNGTCVFETIIAGALPTANGRWNYGSQVGVAGADEQCDANWALSHACVRTEIEAAEAAGELLGLVDTDGTTVNSVWIEDLAAPDVLRCVDSANENLPWTYETAHLGIQGYYAELDNAAGSLGDVTVGVCNADLRHTVCCY